MPDCVSFVIATCNRRDLLEDAVNSVLNQSYPHTEIVVVSNGSTDGTQELFTQGAAFDHPDVKFYHFENQLGVSEARNVGYEKATGDILITIDDDAVVQNEDAAEIAVREFEESSNLGILSFKIVNQYTNRVEPDKIPTRDESQTGDKPFESSYFLGGGNAILASVLQEVGDYPSDFTYSFEELDLSYRVLDAGFRIKYTPDIVVIHNAQPKSEGVPSDVLEQYLTNRIKVAVRNLPRRYAVVSSLIWCCYVIYRSKFNPLPAVSAVSAIIRDWESIHSSRNVIGDEAIKKIKATSGRLWL